MTNLEKKWWFLIPVTILAGLITWWMLQVNGIESGRHWSFALVFALCVVAIENLFSFLIWTAVVMVSPRLAKKLS